MGKRKNKKTSSQVPEPTAVAPAPSLRPADPVIQAEVRLHQLVLLEALVAQQPGRTFRITDEEFEAMWAKPAHLRVEAGEDYLLATVVDGHIPLECGDPVEGISYIET